MDLKVVLKNLRVVIPEAIALALALICVWPLVLFFTAANSYSERHPSAKIFVEPALVFGGVLSMIWFVFILAKTVAWAVEVLL